jgi:hypothetical protein
VCSYTLRPSQNNESLAGLRESGGAFCGGPTILRSGDTTRRTGGVSPPSARRYRVAGTGSAAAAIEAARAMRPDPYGDLVGRLMEPPDSCCDS